MVTENICVQFFVFAMQPDGSALQKRYQSASIGPIWRQIIFAELYGITSTALLSDLAIYAKGLT